ncbi:unnamed protein product [Cuscuta epithymum]|uniref:Uncharacterized protein n=1 Tax=Cuscuta epithymum TaxID=186058 RepID=A0AAV0DCB9_9ASTE|nr:unnamed protein product [Cuscuta epithymum]CAH9138329.1 unnamed protein product [Cuscuta epithymum]
MEEVQEEDAKTKNNEQNNEQQTEGESSDSPPPPTDSPSPSSVTDLCVTDVPDEHYSEAYSKAYFDDLFGPASTGLWNYIGPGGIYANNARSRVPPDQSGMSGETKILMPRISEGDEWPTNFTTSIFYGAQDVVDIAPSNHSKIKDGDEETILKNYATRGGDWWKGSYNY